MQRFTQVELLVPSNIARRLIFHASKLQSPTRDGIASVFARSAGFVYHFGNRGKHSGRIGFQDKYDERVWSMDFPFFDSVKVNYTANIAIQVPPQMREAMGRKTLPPGRSRSFAYDLQLDADWYKIIRSNAPRNGMSDSEVMDVAFKYYEAFWWHSSMEDPSLIAILNSRCMSWTGKC